MGSNASSSKSDESYEHDWIIQSFNCAEYNSDFNLPTTKFEFELKNGKQFKAAMSLLNRCCKDRKCRLFLECTNGSNWAVKCSISCDDEPISEFILSNGTKQKYFGLISSQQYTNNVITRTCSLPSRNPWIKIKVLYVTSIQDLDPLLSTVENPKPEINQAFVELFRSRKFADVTFEVSGREICAHKGILASHSKVFAAMFKLDMIEAQSNRVTIEDIDFDVFEEMMRYMYTGEVENINEMAMKLFAASDEYDLENLKNLCANELASQMTTDNAAEILILADLHTANELKEVSIKFINNNKEAIFNTEGWTNILVNYMYLLNDLYRNA